MKQQMKRNQSAISTQSDNSKLLQAWFNLENALRDTSTQAEESQISNFYVSQTLKPNSSNLFRQYADFHSQNAESQRPFSSNTSSQQQKFFATIKSTSSIKRPFTATEKPPRPLTAGTKQQIYTNRPQTSSGPIKRPQTGISEEVLLNEELPSMQFKLPVSQIASIKSLINLKAKAIPHKQHGAENIHVPKNDLALINELNDEELENVVMNSEYIHSLKVDRIIELYNAKCLDSKQQYQPHHAVKFVEKVKKQCAHKKFILSECALSYQSARIIKELLINNSHFFQLDLGRNNLGNRGLREISKALLKNRNIIHLDISSNNIQPEGAYEFFTILHQNSSLVSVDISSKEGLNRNKVSVYGCEPLETLFKINPPLQFLNMKGTAIGQSGFECLLAGLQQNSSLVYLNVAQNDLTHESIQLMETYLERCQLEELDLSQNNLGNQAMDYLSNLFHKESFQLKRLNLSNCKIKSLGCMKLFRSLSQSKCLEHLIMDQNWLAGNGFLLVQNMLESQLPIQKLSFEDCQINVNGAESLGQGLIKNQSLKYLNLESNRIYDAGGQAIAKGFQLEYLNLKSCAIGDSAALHLCNLMKNSTKIQTVILADNNMSDSSGILISEAVRSNSRIRFVDVSQNPLGYRYQEDIEKIVKRNVMFSNMNRVPEYLEQVRSLSEYEQQKYVLDAEENSFREMRRAAEQELKNCTDAKQKLREQEMEQTAQAESEFYQKIQELRELDKLRERLEKQTRDDIMTMEDEANDLSKKMAANLSEINRLEKDTRSLKEHLQMRKNQLDSKHEFLKRELIEKTKKMQRDEVGLKSFKQNVGQLQDKIEKWEKKLKLKIIQEEQPQVQQQQVEEQNQQPVIDQQPVDPLPQKQQKKNGKQSKKNTKQNKK